MSGWTKTVYFAAALQSIHLINIYGDLAFAALWLLPWVIASVMVRAKWAAVGVEKARALEANRVAAHGKR